MTEHGGLRVYVAGRTRDIDSVRAAQDICRSAGCDITFDWTGNVMSDGRPVRVGDLVRPVHRQFGPQEPGYVIRVEAIQLLADTCQAVEIRRGDRTCVDYVVTGPWSMEPVGAAAAGASSARTAKRTAMAKRNGTAIAALLGSLLVTATAAPANTPAAPTVHDARTATHMHNQSYTQGHRPAQACRRRGRRRSNR